MRALIITWTGFQDHEVIYPYYRLQGAGFEVQIAADQKDSKGRVYGIFGCNMPCHLVLERDPLPSMADVDLLVLPGGVKALEKLRQSTGTLLYIRTYSDFGALIASICHGAQLLISTGLCRGRTIAAYPSIKDDITNAGGTWSGDPVVASDNIISSPHYYHMGDWMEAVIDAVRVRKAQAEIERAYRMAP
jgi:protease I